MAFCCCMADESKPNTRFCKPAGLIVNVAPLLVPPPEWECKLLLFLLFSAEAMSLAGTCAVK